MRLFWIDTETRCALDLTKTGAHRYVDDPSFDVLLVSYAMGDDEVSTWLRYFAISGVPRSEDPVPPELIEAWVCSEVIFAAHNAEFDMLVMNKLMARYGHAPLPPSRWFDTAAYARAHNLPGALGRLTLEYLPSSQRKKAELGKSLSWMWDAKIPLLPRHDGEMMQQAEYCEADVDSMRAAFALLPPPTVEYMQAQEAHLMINARGVRIDREMVKAAVALSPVIDKETTAEINGLTDGQVKPRGPSLRKWLEANMPEEYQPLLQVVRKSREGFGWVSVKKISTDRYVRQRLKEALDADSRPIAGTIRTLLDLFEDANRTGGTKFLSIDERADAEGILCGSFMLNGAAQTGRFSSVGTQMHNTVRNVPKTAPQIIANLTRDELIQAPTELTKRLVEITGNPKMTITLAMSQTVRPAIMARKGKRLIWGDWSAIEARTLPWLTAHRRAQRVLDAYAEGRDLYVEEAAGIFGIPMDRVGTFERQAGKVAILACGFGGAVGAYQSMARNYGMKIEDSEADRIVKAWRSKNKWAGWFWKALNKAAMSAIRHPRAVFRVGRIEFVYVPALLRGSLIMTLPSGRYLVYPEASIAMVEKFDSPQPTVVFRHPTYGMVDTYGGRLAENGTQAEAATLLRAAMYALRDLGVLHVHDELLIEVDDNVASVEAGCRRLQQVMLVQHDWAEGLPLACEIEHGLRYKIGEKWKQ